MVNTNNNFKIKLGIFVITGLSLFILAIFIIGKQKHLFNATIYVNAVFGKVSGLQVGNNVRFAGINVGTVDMVTIKNDTSVLVEMIIDRNIQKFIKVDSYASIGSEGLMGDRIIIITPGSINAKIISENAMLPSTDPTETDEIMSNLKVTTYNAAVITDQLAEIMIKVNSGEGTLGKLLFDSTLALELGKTINNLNMGTKGFSDNMEAAKHNFLLRGFFKRKEKEKEREKIENATKKPVKKAE